MGKITEEHPTPSRDSKEYVGTSPHAALQPSNPLNREISSANRSINDKASHSSRSGAPSTAVPTCFQHVTPQPVEMAAEMLTMGGRGRMFPNLQRSRPSTKTTRSQPPCTVRALPSIPESSVLCAARGETSGLCAKGEIFGPATPSKTNKLSRACMAQRVLPASTLPTDVPDSDMEEYDVTRGTKQVMKAGAGNKPRILKVVPEPCRSLADTERSRLGRDERTTKGHATTSDTGGVDESLTAPDAVFDEGSVSGDCNSVLSNLATEKPLFTKQDPNLASSCMAPRVLPVSSLPTDVPDSDMEEYDVTRGTKQAMKAGAGNKPRILKVVPKPCRSLADTVRSRLGRDERTTKGHATTSDTGGVDESLTAPDAAFDEGSASGDCNSVLSNLVTEKPLFTTQDPNLASSCMAPRVLPVSSLPTDVPDSDMEEYDVTRGTKQVMKAGAGNKPRTLKVVPEPCRSLADTERSRLGRDGRTTKGHATTSDTRGVDESLTAPDAAFDEGSASGDCNSVLSNLATEKPLFTKQDPNLASSSMAPRVLPASTLPTDVPDSDMEEYDVTRGTKQAIKAGAGNKPRILKVVPEPCRSLSDTERSHLGRDERTTKGHATASDTGGVDESLTAPDAAFDEGSASGDCNSVLSNLATEKPLFTKQDPNLASSCMASRVIPVSSLPADVPDSDMEEYDVTRGTKQAMKAGAGNKPRILKVVPEPCRSLSDTVRSRLGRDERTTKGHATTSDTGGVDESLTAPNAAFDEGSASGDCNSVLSNLATGSSEVKEEASAVAASNAGEESLVEGVETSTNSRAPQNNPPMEEAQASHANNSVSRGGFLKRLNSDRGVVAIALGAGFVAGLVVGICIRGKR